MPEGNGDVEIQQFVGTIIKIKLEQSTYKVVNNIYYFDSVRININSVEVCTIHSLVSAAICFLSVGHYQEVYLIQETHNDPISYDIQACTMRELM